MDRELILVTGAGGFIGGHLIRDLVQRGHTNIRAVDVKPLNEWYQVFDGAENLVLNLSLKDSCDRACENVSKIYNLASDMEEWVSSRQTKHFA